MKATDDLEKAGITAPHAEAISSTLHRVVDNQAATKEELEKTNEALAAQGKDLAALKTAQEAQGKEQIEQGKALAALTAAQEAQGRALEKTNETLAAQGKEQVEQGKVLAALAAGQEAQDRAQEKQDKRIGSLVATIRWFLGLSAPAVLFVWLEWNQTHTEINQMYVDMSQKQVDMNQRLIDLFERVIAGAVEKPVAVVNPPPVSEANGGAEPDTAEAESPAGAATAVAVQR